MNQEAKQVLSRLRARFRAPMSMLSDRMFWQGVCPIGLEVEIKWRDYFPGLWEKYLKDRAYSDLSEGEKALLTAKCAALETSLLPRLEATIACGVKKGADRYWEFAFGPATDVIVLADQVSVLQNANLIPEGEHSLHMTIGNLRATQDTYYLLMLLESMSSSEDRIKAGFHAENSKLSAGWARKGLGGIFEKGAADLEYGYQHAIELRTLLLSGDSNIADLLCAAAYSADAIYHKERQIMSPDVRPWQQFASAARDILADHGLADVNWKKPNLAPQYWEQYVAVFGQMRSDLVCAYNEHLRAGVCERVATGISKHTGEQASELDDISPAPTC